MEAILYNLGNILTPIIIFLGIVLFIGIIIYIITAKFDIHKKSIRYCGLLSGFNNKQIIILSAIMIRTFLELYLVFRYGENVYIYLAMIFFVDLVYIVLLHKNILFELINIIAQIIILYLINTLKEYSIEIIDQMYLTQVIIVLMIFITLYSIYFALKNFDNLLSEKKNTKVVKTSSKSTSSRSAKKIDTEKTQSEKVQVEKKQIVKKQKEPPKAKTSKKAKKPGKHYKQEGW